MSEIKVKVGNLLENSMRQFAKVISVKNGVYGISGWTTRVSAEKATVVAKRINKYGLINGNVRVTKGGDASSANAPADDNKASGASRAARTPRSDSNKKKSGPAKKGNSAKKSK